jgi:DNA-binding transcriptional LysR family regulator
VGRLTVAATRLHIDHGTLSRRIDCLEAALNVKLFDRSPHGYALTIAGSRLVRSAESMEITSLEGAERVSDGGKTPSGQVRIAAPDVLGSLFLAPRLTALADRYPKLELQLLTTPRSSSLTKREADIVIGTTRPERGRLASRKLTQYELGIYGTSAYLESRPAISTINDLGEHRLIGYVEEMLHSNEINRWSQVNSTLRASFCSTNMISQMNGALSNGGLCILPCWMVHEERRLVRVLPEEVRLMSTLWLMLNSDLRNLKRVRITCDFIAAEILGARSLFVPESIT